MSHVTLKAGLLRQFLYFFKLAKKIDVAIKIVFIDLVNVQSDNPALELI